MEGPTYLNSETSDDRSGGPGNRSPIIAHVGVHMNSVKNEGMNICENEGDHLRSQGSIRVMVLASGAVS